MKKHEIWPLTTNRGGFHTHRDISESLSSSPFNVVRLYNFFGIISGSTRLLLGAPRQATHEQLTRLDIICEIFYVDLVRHFRCCQLHSHLA